MLARYFPITLFLIALILYSPSLGYEFTYDDYIHIEKNDYVTSEDISLDQIFSVFKSSTFPGDLYRPIVMLSFRLQFLSSGINPFYYHFFNILFNALVSILVFYFVDSILKSPLISFFASLIYTVHPLHVEAVANIFGRNEILSAFFILSSLLLFRLYFEKNRISLLFLSLSSTFIALLSKESATTFYLILPLYIAYFFSSFSILFTRKFLFSFFTFSFISFSLLIHSLRSII